MLRLDSGKVATLTEDDLDVESEKASHGILG
jgi:hypothetical protein